MLPKKIKVGWLSFKTILNQELSEESGNYGSVHYKTQKIFINPLVEEQTQESTYVHEMLHSIIFLSGLSERLKNIDGITEEEIVASIEGLLYQVLKDNDLIYTKKTTKEK